MDHDFITLSDHGLPATAELLRLGFADYLVPIKFTTESLDAMARADQVDFTASPVIRRAGAPVGVALIARRGTTCRLAGMSLVPDARGQGLGRALLERSLDDARARGDTAMVLEVINQNAPALKLYQASGFSAVQELLGFAAEPDSDADATPVEERPLADFIAAARAHESPDTPWQISAETLATVTPDRHTAVFVDPLWVLVGHPPADLRVIRGLVSTDPNASPESVASALQHIRRHWLDLPWRAAALFPAACAPWFLGAGFTTTELSQTQMVKPL